MTYGIVCGDQSNLAHRANSPDQYKAEGLQKYEGRKSAADWHDGGRNCTPRTGRNNHWG